MKISALGEYGVRPKLAPILVMFDLNQKMFYPKSTLYNIHIGWDGMVKNISSYYLFAFEFHACMQTLPGSSMYNI